MARKRGGGRGWLIFLGLILIAVWAAGRSGPSAIAPTVGPTGAPATVAPSQSPAASSPAGSDTTPTSTVYVSATTLNVRASPSTTALKVGQVARGASLGVLEKRGDWMAIQLPSGERGWVHGDYVSDQPIAVIVALPKVDPVPTYDRDAIVQRIIQQSLASYSGNCPCPENRDRAGRRCGKRSAWSRGGGARPLCYPDDVTDAMIRAFVTRD